MAVEERGAPQGQDDRARALHTTLLAVRPHRDGKLSIRPKSTSVRGVGEASRTPAARIVLDVLEVLEVLSAATSCGSQAWPGARRDTRRAGRPRRRWRRGSCRG